MTTFKGKNFAGVKASRLAELGVKDGDTFEGCNLAQSKPHTKILDGIKNLTFRSCNMRNVDPPDGAVLEDTPNSHWDRCSNLHPNKSELTKCKINCKHVVKAEKITIDGVLIDTIYTYKDLKVI